MSITLTVPRTFGGVLLVTFTPAIPSVPAYVKVNATGRDGKVNASGRDGKVPGKAR